MAITTTMAEGVERAERTLAIWNRVCSELEEGKPWEEIDNGMIPSAKGMKLRPWRAYMESRMRHQLQELVWIYRHGPDLHKSENE